MYELSYLRKWSGGYQTNAKRPDCDSNKVARTLKKQQQFKLKKIKVRKWIWITKPKQHLGSLRFASPNLAVIAKFSHPQWLTLFIRICFNIADNESGCDAEQWWDFTVEGLWLSTLGGNLIKQDHSIVRGPHLHMRFMQTSARPPQLFISIWEGETWLRATSYVILCGRVELLYSD